MYYFGIDIYYFVLIIPCIILAAVAQGQVSATFKKYSAVRTRRGITAEQAAQRVLSANGVTGVQIQRVSGNLTDHYDPRTNVIRLSDTVYGSQSVAAVGVAAHEAGHAVQYAKQYAPIKIRAAIIPITNIGSNLSWPLILIGLIFNSSPLLLTGILFFSFSTVFQLITLPVELNASGRAIRALSDGGILYEEEVPMAKKTLRAAAMTYVAALAVSIAQLLRLLLIFGGRRRD